MKINDRRFLEFLIVNETNSPKVIKFFNKDNPFEAEDGLHALFLSEDPWILNTDTYNSIASFAIGLAELQGQNICAEKSLTFSVMGMSGEIPVPLFQDVYQVCENILCVKERINCYKKDEYQIITTIPALAKLFFRFWLYDIEFIYKPE